MSKKSVKLGVFLAPILIGLEGAIAAGEISTSNVTGQTTANEELVRDVLNLLTQYESIFDKTNCQSRKLLSIELKDSHANNGKEIKELWIIDRCGRTINYEVSFIADPRGGTFIHIIYPRKMDSE